MSSARKLSMGYDGPKRRHTPRKPPAAVTDMQLLRHMIQQDTLPSMRLLREVLDRVGRTSDKDSSLYRVAVARCTELTP